MTWRRLTADAPFAGGEMTVAGGDCAEEHHAKNERMKGPSDSCRNFGLMGGLAAGLEGCLQGRGRRSWWARGGGRWRRRWRRLRKGSPGGQGGRGRGRRGRWVLEGDGGCGLLAGFVGTAAALADLGETGMWGGGFGVGGDGGLELDFGLGDEALGEVFLALLGVLGGLLGRGEGGEASGTELVHLEGGLAEGGLGVGAADAG